MERDGFDRRCFVDRLATRRLGHRLLVRAETESTNDDAWAALAEGAPDGTVVVADHQTRGRGRSGRSWHSTPGQGLAMSVLLHLSCEPGARSTLPLVVGLALARALERLGVDADLEWPNDLVLSGRKVAGILCEARRTAAGADAAVAGIGVNVAQRAGDFPDALRETATSLALEGHDVAREDLAAELLNALEPLWTEHAEGDPAIAIRAWRARARFWNAPVAARTPGGEVRGIARTLDEDGALVVEVAGGARVRVVAGDVEVEDSRSAGGGAR